MQLGNIFFVVLILQLTCRSIINWDLGILKIVLFKYIDFKYIDPAPPKNNKKKQLSKKKQIVGEGWGFKSVMRKFDWNVCYLKVGLKLYIKLVA